MNNTSEEVWQALGVADKTYNDGHLNLPKPGHQCGCDIEYFGCGHEAAIILASEVRRLQEQSKADRAAREAMKRDLEMAHRVVDAHKEQAKEAVRIGCENITAREKAEAELAALKAEIERTKLCEYCDGCKDCHKHPCSNCKDPDHAAWECVLAPAPETAAQTVGEPMPEGEESK
jgi:hypothetical protein